MNKSVLKLYRLLTIERIVLFAVLFLQVILLVKLHNVAGVPDRLQVEIEAATAFDTSRSDAVEERFRQADPLTHAMDSMMENALANVERLRSQMHVHAGLDRAHALPSLDMRDMGGVYLVTFSLPGVNPVDLDVMLDGRLLTVQALCLAPGQSGIRYPYERRVLLPGPIGDVEKAKVLLTNDVLRVHIPKAGQDSVYRQRPVTKLY